MYVTFSGIFTDFILKQNEHISSEITVTFLGITKDFNFVQAWSANVPIDSTFFGISIDSKLSQFGKTFEPITVTSPLKTIVCNFELFVNISFSISVIEEGKTISVEATAEKAPAPILFTLSWIGKSVKF